MNPKISFIVSAYDRPRQLACVLASLAVQTLKDIEVIVTDNQLRPVIATDNFLAVQMVRDRWNDNRFRYFQCFKPHCYHSAEHGVTKASGEYLCFPSDDNYYVPQFAELMVRAAEQVPVPTDEHGLPRTNTEPPEGGTYVPRFAEIMLAAAMKVDGERPTSNVQRPTSNVQHRTKMGGSGLFTAIWFMIRG